MVVEYNYKENNAYEVVISCNYFNEFITEVYNNSDSKKYYDYEVFVNYILGDWDDEIKELIDIISMEYPLLYKFYKDKSDGHSTFYEFIIQDLALVNMSYIEVLIRKDKIKTLLNA